MLITVKIILVSINRNPHKALIMAVLQLIPAIAPDCKNKCKVHVLMSYPSNGLLCSFFNYISL